MPYSDWTEQRRNFVRNPDLEGSTTQWAWTGYTAVGRQTSGLGSFTTFLKGTRSSLSSVIYRATCDLDMPQAGESITVRATLRSNRTTTVDVGVRPTAANTNAVILGTVELLAGEVTTIEVVGNTFNQVPTAPSVTFGATTTGATTTDVLEVTGVSLELTATANSGGPLYIDGNLPDTEFAKYDWVGSAYTSASTYSTRTYVPVEPVTPIKSLSSEDVLYNDRVTTYRWEVLSHSNGVDQLVGILDGVADGSLTWVQNAAVKGAGKVEVLDLDVAAPGLMRVADLQLESVRLRPVCSIVGLPEQPLGVFLVSNAGEKWDATGRTWSLELLDKCTVPSQDLVDQSYAVPAGALILQTVRSILASSGEYIAISDTSTLATSSGMVWEAGTSKLKIINDLLDVAGYNSLWMDGFGNFMVTPRVLPADRPINYEVLGVPRELRDGRNSIYESDWTRDRDSFEVPNKVIAVQAAGGEDESALVGQWTNEDSTSPYSYQARGRWVTYVLDSVETPEGTPAQTVAFLEQRARATLIQMSAVQAQVKLNHLPIPARVSDVVRFSHTRAGVDARHIITRIQLDTNPLGLMTTNLQEVISL